MKCKVLSSTIVYKNEYFKPGTIFNVKDEDVKGLVEGGFVVMIDTPKEAEVTEESTENKELETVEKAPEAEEKPAKEPKSKGGKKK